jgi:hypothetical protein
MYPPVTLPVGSSPFKLYGGTEDFCNVNRSMHLPDYGAEEELNFDRLCAQDHVGAGNVNIPNRLLGEVQVTLLSSWQV